MEKTENQKIFEQKNSRILYEKSHICGNLTEWLALEEQDFFWEIPAQMEQKQVLERLRKEGAQTGRMVLALSNRFGVEAWNRTGELPKISFKGIRETLEEMGFCIQRIYYPYPNCDFPMKIYSDDYLPKMGELRNNRMRNFREKTCFFQEEEAFFNQVIEEGNFPVFSNAYLLVAERNDKRELPVFVQYANDRAPEFQMKTEIRKKGQGYTVVKKPMHPLAKEHCEGIYRCCGQLEKAVAETDFSMNRCVKVEGGLEFEFLRGKTLDEKIKEFLQKGELESAKAAIRKFVGYLLDMAVRPFGMTKEFEHIFGKGLEFDGGMSMKVTDIDLIFRNIIVGEHWNVIDYEWTFDFPIPVDFVIYRAFEAFLEKESGETSMLNPYELYPISERDKESYGQMEQNFQRYVSRNYHTLDEMYLEFGKPCDSVEEQLVQKDKQIEQLKQQIAQMENTKVWKAYRKYRNWRERK